MGWETIEPDPSWKVAGQFRVDDAENAREALELQARRGVYATDLPSAPRGHTPRWEDFPRGWTVQQPWFHPEYPPPAVVRCILCAQQHPPGSCPVLGVLVALDNDA